MKRKPKRREKDSTITMRAAYALTNTMLTAHKSIEDAVERAILATNPFLGALVRYKGDDLKSVYVLDEVYMGDDGVLSAQLDRVEKDAHGKWYRTGDDLEDNVRGQEVVHVTDLRFFKFITYTP